MSRRLIWLASYPKSGSTWIRAFLSAYDLDGSVSFARLPGRDAASHQIFWDHIGVEAADLPDDVVRSLRPRVFAGLAAGLTNDLLLKTHDAYGRTSSGEPVFPAAVSRGVVYVVRHPLDVAVSWAFHAGISTAQAVAFLDESDASLPPRGASEGPGRELPQVLGTWSAHVQSWLLQTVMPTTVVRYEDLLTDPFSQFSRVLKGMGIDVEVDRLRRAVGAASFDTLQALERSTGFREKLPGAAPFFRAGRSAAYREHLNEQQVDRLLRAQAPGLKVAGYT